MLLQEQFRELPLVQVHESPTNPRRRFNVAALNELAANVKRHGILMPILTREVASGFEIIAGARRFRAAKIAELETIPVRVCEMGDAEVLEVQVIENLQREDVHPIEEADGYQALIDRHGYTVATLAERCNRSESYIVRRLRLTKLEDQIKSLFLDGELQLGHALLFARLDPERQLEALKANTVKGRGQWIRDKYVEDNAIQYRSVRDLDQWIQLNVYLDLAGAPWMKGDALLDADAGACTTCAKRTGANGLLFDDVKKGDHCLDSTCFDRKRSAHLVNLKATTPLSVATSYVDQGLRKGLGEFTPQGGFTQIKGKTDRCESKEKAVVVAGSDVGRVIDICRDRKCVKHKSRWSSSHVAEDGGQSPAALARAEAKIRRDKLNAKIDHAYRRQVLAEIVGGVGAAGLVELRLIAGQVKQGLRKDAQSAIENALGSKFNELVELIPVMDALPLVQFCVACALSPTAEEYCYVPASKQLFATAEEYSVNLDEVKELASQSLIAKFERAEASRKKREAEAKKVAKKKPGKTSAAASTASVVPDDWESEDDDALDELAEVDE